jgi:hypothetical protein
VRLTSPCKKKFVENLLRGKKRRRDQGSMGCGANDVEDTGLKGVASRSSSMA